MIGGVRHNNTGKKINKQKKPQGQKSRGGMDRKEEPRLTTFEILRQEVNLFY